ncbi:UvrD-helicase domain-containing protein [Alteromonas sp. 14N.309.X.WAT.G.H12]|uniref:UvrD-helicase domain-containing protein n=1 Tax=Alteromonas sp. 14N.309.X.WAT.G.H12 TaxID=3120824 RepID=UPI002FD60920
MDYTEEQKKTIYFKGRNLIVKSGAGTGKTTILKGYAKENPNSRFLYLCYNSDIQKEAKASFPANVVCRTGHAIARAMVCRPLEHKVADNIRLTDVKEFIKTNDWGLTKDVVKGLNAFLHSNRNEISLVDISFLPNFTAAQKRRNALILSCIKKIWVAGMDPKSSFPTTHDMYLKKFCMGPPTMHRWFSGILLDEAQDSNPVISDWVLKHDQCKHILVGDDHQQLYRWRGAQNFMENYAKKTNCQINLMQQSFRFGEKTALVASKLLEYKSHITGCPPFSVHGTKTIDDKVYVLRPALFNNQHRAILHRTVIGTLDSAIQNIDKKIYWAGGINSYTLPTLLDVYYLKKDMRSSIKNKKLLREHRTFDSYRLMAEGTQDPEMMRIIKLLEQHGNSIPGKIAALRRNAVNKESQADLTVSTAHRAKGREWEHVEVSNDFPDLLDEAKDLSEDFVSDEINLLYVACTRSMGVLVVPNIVAAIYKKMGGDLKLFDREGGASLRTTDTVGKMTRRVKLNQG